MAEQTSKGIRDLLAVVFVLGSIAAIVVSSFLYSTGWIVESLSEFGISWQGTNQVRIHETNETERTRIEWNGRIRITELETNADIRTSTPALGHRVYDDMRLAVTCLTVLALFGGFLFLTRIK